MATFKTVDPKFKFRGIYYLDQVKSDSSGNWEDHCGRCRGMELDYIAIPQPFAPKLSGISDDAVSEGMLGTLVNAARAEKLGVLTDISIDRVDAEGTLAHARPDLSKNGHDDSLDPRRMGASDTAVMNFDRPEVAERWLAFWSGCLKALLASGVNGFRFLNPGATPLAFWRALVEELREAFPQALLLAFTPGMAWRDIAALSTVKFDGVFSSLPWWDRRASWFAEELDLLRRVAPIIACPEMPFGLPLASRVGSDVDKMLAYRQALDIAAATGDAIMITGGFEQALRDSPDLTQTVHAALQRLAKLRSLAARGEIRALSTAGSPVTALIRLAAADARNAPHAVVVVINPDLAQTHELDVGIDPVGPRAGAALGHAVALDGHAAQAPLAPGEVRAVKLERLQPIRRECPLSRQQLSQALEAPRIVIDALTPRVDDGRLAVKRLSGEEVIVAADVFTDGHGLIDAELLWKEGDTPDWHRLPMRQGDNDRWRARFTPGRIGRHWFTIEAWLDEFGGLCRDVEIKQRAGLDIGLELKEAQKCMEAALTRSTPAMEAPLARMLKQFASANASEAVAILLALETRALMRQAHMRPFATRHEPAIAVEVGRPQAGFAAWYELFPRSASPVPGRHGSFDDVVAKLPFIRAMGFDVLYLPPIHPIGRTNRKGHNNSLTAAPDDPGSPYAIGAAEGGHEALHPQLGSFDDFRRLIAAAADQGMEIALDFAIQCSPDHPWLKEHPDWFRWRPDGSLRFAENPPKKYEDIVNVEFYADGAARALWTALRDVVLFWIAQGVRIFRVDNPHTKPLPFWEWLIADINARHPDTIFLAEAFTRPKMMYRLAKIGFSQSYTYFTWRNTKRELTDYMTELTAAPVADYFRPHFFVNTPDINPYFLQRSGRAGFLIRAVLAATLSGLWGIYSGFELCEAAPLPGREEYADSEKYQIKQRDFDAAGNITAEIAALNRIRKSHAALQSHLGLKFYNAYNEQILLYGKALPARRDMILVAVNLDPHHAQEATFELPLWEWNIEDDGSLAVEDLLQQRNQVWTGKLQSLRLDPAHLPYAIWRIAPFSEGRP